MCSITETANESFEKTATYKNFHQKKNYEVYLFFNFNDEIILKDDVEIWDTVHEYPKYDEDDIAALKRFSFEQFGIRNVNFSMITFLSSDNLGNKFYMYKCHMRDVTKKFSNLTFKHVNNKSYHIFEEYIDYYAFYNLRKIFNEIPRSSRENRLKRRLIRQGIIKRESMMCVQCNQYNCICYKFC
jgi:hypothetical protein